MHSQGWHAKVAGAESRQITFFVINGVDWYLAYLKASFQLDGRIILQHKNVCVCVCVCGMANWQGSLREQPLYILEYVT